MIENVSMSKTKILILSDSLALPRQAPEQCAFDKTWPFLLKRLPETEIIQVSIGGATIKDLVKQVGYYKPFDPQIVILQSGIVDCSPRFATRFEQDVIAKIPVPFIKKSVLKMLNQAAVRRWRNVTYTRPKDFKSSLQAIERKLSPAAIIAVGIISPTQNYEKLLPGITKNVQVFNAIIETCYGDKYVDVTTFPAEGIMSVHHHINDAGHDFIFKQLKQKISAITSGRVLMSET
jgi:hypothetical protein